MDMLITQISAIVRECGDIVLRADRGNVGVDTKAGHANFVTAYDRQVQQILKEKLLQILPEAVFVGEEEDVHASLQDGFAFIVDPIDGTTNFIRDYHVSAISVGLIKDGERYIGVVYNPYLDEMFTVKRGEGAYLNGKPIHVSNRTLTDGIVIFGTAPYYEEYAEESFRLACDYFRKCVDVRRSGSAALDICNVAAGRAELFFELALSPWDHAAAGLLVEEAGGTVTTMDGKPVRFDTLCSVKATNGVAM